MALYAVMLQQIRQHFRACQVIDRNNFYILPLVKLPERKSSDTSKTVDCYLHGLLLSHPKMIQLYSS